MEESLEKKSKSILNENVKNIELISYFCKSTNKTPIFLSDIQKSYSQIKPLLNKGLIKELKPVKSYIFNIDKFENYFYNRYQGKIDILKDEIWRRKRRKNELIKLTEDLEPEMGSEDYDQKLMEVLEFAKNSIGELDDMELEKEDYNSIIGEFQIKMKQDPYYKFLMFIRNDKEMFYNKRTEDDKGVIHKKILNYLNGCTGGKGWKIFTEFKQKNFFKEYSPAQNYYITKLGISVDFHVKKNEWDQDAVYQKNEAETEQEKEFNKFLEESKGDNYFLRE